MTIACEKWKEMIQSPSREYSPAAFWFLNGDLKPDEMRKQVREMADQGVYQFFLHARACLETPYLEQGWWDAMEAAVDEAKRVGAYAWLYDEYAWPSGTAGSTFSLGTQKPSRVLAKGECNMAKGLHVKELVNEADLMEENYLHLYEITYHDTGSIQKVSEIFSPKIEIKNSKNKKILGFYRVVDEKMVDYLNKDTIREFINETHERYQEHFGDEFGKTIPGIFFDEIYNSSYPIVWTDRMEDEFYQRKGYELASILPYIIEPIEEADKQYRKDYHEVVAQLYEEAFFKQISAWCEDHHLLLTGHTEEDLARHPLKQGDYFKTMKHLHIPGSDCHDYRYRYPRIITPEEAKYSVSVARMYSRKRSMSEALGGAGWNCSPQEFKRGINRLGALGTNLFILHGFYYGLESQAAQGDWPTSFFFQNPYWKYFHKFAEYISRISYTNSLGQSGTEIGIYYPISELHGEYENGNTTKTGTEIADCFNQVLLALVEKQMDADFIDRDSFYNGTIQNGRLNMGEDQISVMLFPKNLDQEKMMIQKIQECKEAGILVLFYHYENVKQIPKLISDQYHTDFMLHDEEGDLHYNHRKIKGTDLYFVANGRSEKRMLRFTLRAYGTPTIYRVEDAVMCAPQCWERGKEGITICMQFEEDEAFYIIIEDDIKLKGTWEQTILPFDEQAQGALEIPVALFSDSLNKSKREIRICNTSKEVGFCGRHITNWKGYWITRRTSWQCDSNKKDLYFRKKIQIDEEILSASFCVAAVGEFELFINGESAVSGVGYNSPTIVELKKYFKVGDNFIAIHVHNEQALRTYNVLEAKNLPPDRLISLLLEGSIQGKTKCILVRSDSDFQVNDTEMPGWNKRRNLPDENVKTLDAKAIPCFWKEQHEGEWFYAWERGMVPLQPWGEIPCFGEHVSYPVTCEYEICIPWGTKTIMEPNVSGAYRASLDGEAVVFINGKLEIFAENKIKKLMLSVDCITELDGLKKNIKIESASIRAELGDWRAYGLEWFSGRMSYEKEVELTILKNKKYCLNLGKVQFCAEIWVNGSYVDSRIWEPYEVDITDYLKEGKNHFKLIASNLAGNSRRHLLMDEGQALGWNQYWNRENIDREDRNLISGILGPVVVKQIS